MSPEQARGVSVDERTDIWSLGVVLYEMVAGQAPFTGQTPTDVVISIVEKDPPTLSQYLPDVPAELERIVRKALRKDADQRYQIVKEMAIDLRSLRKDLELDSQLERSLAPSLAAGTRTVSGAAATAATGTDKALDTDQLQALRVTTVGSHAPAPSNWPLRLGLLAISLVLLAAGGWVIYKLTRPAPAPQHFQRITVTKLTTNGNALFAAISPDGKYVSYVKSEGGRQSLWLRQVGSAGNLEIVSPREGQYLGIAFSPDGG
jgi:serine/threonine-protein kinase